MAWVSRQDAAGNVVTDITLADGQSVTRPGRLFEPIDAEWSPTLLYANGVKSLTLLSGATLNSDHPAYETYDFNTMVEVEITFESERDTPLRVDTYSGGSPATIVSKIQVATGLDARWRYVLRAAVPAPPDANSLTVQSTPDFSDLSGGVGTNPDAVAGTPYKTFSNAYPRYSALAGGSQSSGRGSKLPVAYPVSVAFDLPNVDFNYVHRFWLAFGLFLPDPLPPKAGKAITRLFGRDDGLDRGVGRWPRGSSVQAGLRLNGYR